MPKKVKLLIMILSIVLALMLLMTYAYFGYQVPYQQAASFMHSNGTMTLTLEQDGSRTLTWPEGSNQDRYQVLIGQEQSLLYETWVSEARLVLPKLPENKNLSIRIVTARGYRFPFEKEERLRMGTGSLDAQVKLAEPVLQDLTVTPDPGAKTVRVQFDLEADSMCRMYQAEASGELTLLDTLKKGDVTFSFGDAEQYPIPRKDEVLTFAFDVCRYSPGMAYYGTVSQQVQVVREDLLDRNLKLERTDLGHNVFQFSWQETKGEGYQVQCYDPLTKDWKVVHEIGLEGERSYTTGHLSRYSQLRYRVVAVGGQTMPGSDYAAISAEEILETGASLIFSTVWPLQELEVYADPQKSRVLGTADTTRAFCVLDEEHGMFRVRFGDSYGYLDSNYCLINLPEFLGDICLYDMVNSDDALYMAHEFELTGVTGKVITGYENVRMTSGEELAPLLYPVALRLEKAAFSAIEQGYRLKIYDAYRPRKATKALYNQAIGLKDEPIPEKTYTGKVLDDLPELPPLPPNEKPTLPEGPEPPEGTEETTAPEEERRLTYEQLMTDFGRYTMSYFLAAGRSMHNRGTALDLTLADAATGEELPMQTSIHDLSWYSEISRNNANARTLASIMKGAGFGGLSSEWWHFQDNEVNKSLNPEYRMEGVSPECWMADDLGWRYRRADGTYYKDCTVQIDEVSYTFDEKGYLLQEER